MRILTGLGAVTRPPRRAVVTVGVFDGVHVGHQQLIRSTIRLARRLGGTSVVITFDPDPETVLHPGTSAPALMPLAARVSALKTLGVDWVWVLPFSKRFARMSADQFVRRFLFRRLRTHTLIVGDAFAFGRGRRGNMEILQRLGPVLGMRVIPVEPITRDGVPVSSSCIRACVRHGDLRQAKRLLGRAPGLYGTVVRGAGRGRRLGCPTANLRLIPQVMPPRGVYAVIVEAASRRWRGVMNLGVRPTFGRGPLICEAHLFRFSGTLLGRPVMVSLLARLRGERRFSSPQALSRQVQRDIARAQPLLAAYSLS